MNGFGLAQCICDTNAKLAKCYAREERKHMTKELFDFVFCCLSQEQQRQIEIALKNNTPTPVYHAQENLVKEKAEYRCKKCGKNGDFEDGDSSAIAFAWFIWEKGFKGEPTIKWFN